MAVSGLSLAIVFIGVIAYAAGGPLQAGPNTLQQNEYERLADILARVYWEDRSLGSRNIDGIGKGHLLRLGRGLDSLSGATFGENKRFISFRRPNMMKVHGNFDEIDRSVFDHFSKRNFDEIDTADRLFKRNNLDTIDRPSWSELFNKLDNYLIERHQRVQQPA